MTKLVGFGKALAVRSWSRGSAQQKWDQQGVALD